MTARGRGMMVRRGPAVEICLPQSMPQFFGQIDHGKIYDTRELDVPIRDYWTTERLDLLQIPPTLEAPRLVPNSLFGPIVRWGFRQWNRGNLQARPRFGERYVLVGKLTKQVDARAKMDGVPTRQAGGGYSYVYPQFFTGDRAVDLGAAGG